jgi:threonine dehydratase
MSLPVTLDGVKAAADTIRASVNETPTLRVRTLSQIAGVVARKRGNIVDVEHRRDLPGVALKRARLELSIETRDRAHAREIVDAITAAGFHVEVA